MPLRFPLPPGYFPKVDMSDDNVQYYKNLVTDLVRETRRDYDRFVKEQRKNVDSGMWKKEKSKERLHVYRRRPQFKQQQTGLYSENTISASTGSYSGSECSNDGSVYASNLPPHLRPRNTAQSRVSSVSSSVDSLDDDLAESKRLLTPMVMGVGVMDGTLDDVIYGLHIASTADMKRMNTFHNDDSVIDCAVLATVKENKSTFLGLKWQLNRTFGGNRDMCYLEFVGISTDSKGKRYGYHVMESVQLPTCPPFEDKSIVRTNMSFCYLFKESEPGSLEVFLQGAFDSSADALTAGGVGDSRSAMDMLMSVDKAVKSAEMKKLAALVTKQQNAPPKRQDMSHCAICRSKSSFMSSHLLCQGCGDVICKKCKVTKIILNSKGKVKVSCCKICLVNVANNSPLEGEKAAPLVERALSQQTVKKQVSMSRDIVPKLARGSTNSSTAATDYSSSMSSYQSSSISSSYSDIEEVYSPGYLAHQSSNQTMMMAERKMPAVMETSSAQYGMTMHAGNNPAYDRYMAPPSAPMRTAGSAGGHQHASRAGLYNQMLELQMAAEKAYTMANQNAAMMQQRQ
ncbi:TPA: hypothetical protein N0F65_000250 [Lagenidium giganteum]|uniref:FYVE-type domain-containing protein n=1 Tax=Lagenidium giganteum TaxID=4803 RepID=A0AAV2Z4X2_9STRA|nr:TPA: hypothetical protein N0F65_000250 [Lagenidium giganteum]